MLKKIYDKYNPEDTFQLAGKFENMNLKDLLYGLAIPGAKIGWKRQKRRFKVIARNDNFIIIARPYNPQKTFQYSILDLEYMQCNHDNCYNKYDYSDENECKEALKELKETRDEEKTLGYSYSNGLQLSRRGITNIKDVVTELWINVNFKSRF